MRENQVFIGNTQNLLHYHVQKTQSVSSTFSNFNTMKNLFFILAHVFLTLTIGYAQNTDSTQQTKPTEAEKQIKIINEKLDAFLKVNETDYIGKIKMYNNSVPRYSKDIFSLKIDTTANNKTDQEKVKILLSSKIENDKIIIDSLEVSISSGVIDFIRVYSGNDIYENESSISLQNFNKAIFKSFIYNTTDNNLFLRLPDFIQYLPNKGNHFIPDDIDFVLSMNEDRKYKVLTANVDLNSHIEVQIYTDFLSFFTNKPNGLIQTEARSKFILNTIPVSGNKYFGNFIDVYFKYSKFDSKFDAFQIDGSEKPKFLKGQERIFLNQYSFLNIGTKLNILKIKSPRFEMETNVGCQYDLANVKYAGEDNKTQIDLFSFFGEVKYSVFRSKNFGMNLGFTAVSQFVASKDVNILSNTLDVYGLSEVLLFYNPKNEKSNKVFLRFRQMTDYVTGQFVNFQIGYSSKLSLTRTK